MNDLIFHQLFEAESSTYTYLIGDAKTKEAALIDPVLETVERDLKLVSELGLKLKFVLDTHIHADHITGAGEIRKRTQSKTGVSQSAHVNCADIPLQDGQELHLGDKTVRVIATPGHTNSCMSFYFEGMVFTGDALLIRGTGRTDFQQGSSSTLYESVTERLFKLPEDTKVYPAHDYKGLTSTTIGAEKSLNPRLGVTKSKADFVKIMSELKLADPKKIKEAVPANLGCGLAPKTSDHIPEITPEDLERGLMDFYVIDVRRADEFDAELSHIATAKLVTLGPDLTAFLEQGDRAKSFVFVCRSGNRSKQATAECLKLGYRSAHNMVGGMLAWNEKSLPTAARSKGKSS